MRARPLQFFAAIAVALLLLTGTLGSLRAHDHADGNGTFPGWDLGGRRDANIGFFFAFQTPAGSPDKLVLILGLNQGISDPGYFFAPDLTVRFHIDNHSAVTFNDDPLSTVDDWMMRFGGTVTAPEKIAADLVFEVTFAPTSDGRTAPQVVIEGLPKKVEPDIEMFPALDESPVRRLGVAWVVLEVPLALVVTPEDPSRPLDDTLLLWATTKVPEVHGPISDHAGMPNTSNQAGNLLVNRFHPRHHFGLINQRPPDVPGSVPLAPYADVLILNLAGPPRGFPSGHSPGLPPPPPFDPFDPTRFPNGHPVSVELRMTPFVFPYIAPQ